jgi:tetratricopeptide repeat protein 30
MFFFFFKELSIGMQTEGIDITSVGNTNTLQDSTLIEAFNLRAAIEFILKNCSYIFIVSIN